MAWFPICLLCVCVCAFVWRRQLITIHLVRFYDQQKGSIIYDGMFRLFVVQYEHNHSIALRIQHIHTYKQHVQLCAPHQNLNEPFSSKKNNNKKNRRKNDYGTENGNYSLLPLSLFHKYTLTITYRNIQQQADKPSITAFHKPSI